MTLVMDVSSTSRGAIEKCRDDVMHMLRVFQWNGHFITSSCPDTGLARALVTIDFSRHNDRTGYHMSAYRALVQRITSRVDQITPAAA